MRILLVEDDEAIAHVLVSTLNNQNYLVDVATDGQEGWQLVEGCLYDLIVLDVGLPKIDGITLCRKMRSQGYQMPILLLTSRDSTQDKVMGLDAGADDYLVKPCEAQELSARIRALLRRGDSALPPVISWGSLELNPNTFEVTYEEEMVNLTPTEYRLLELFMRNSSRVYSRTAILDHLWSFEDPPGEETIRAHIKGLRQKLKGAGAPADLIETVYGLGYRLKPLPKKNETTPAISKILLAGLPDELGEWLVQRLEYISVETAYTGEETLQYLTTDKWSLILIDEGLREPSVSEVLRLGSKKNIFSKIPIIFCQKIVKNSDKRSIISQLIEPLNYPIEIFNITPPINREKLARQVAEKLSISLSPPPEKQLTPAKTITEPTVATAAEEGKTTASDHPSLFTAEIHQEQDHREAIAEVWERFKERIGNRVTVLEQATIALRAGILDDELRQLATQDAHKLIGSLGTFGFANGSGFARKIESILEQPKVGREAIPELEKLVQNLREELEHKPNETRTDIHKTSQTTASSESDRLVPQLLIIDRDRAVAEQMEQEAQRWGITVKIVEDLSTARQAIAQGRPEMVLLDLAISGQPCSNLETAQEGLQLLAELTNHVSPVPVLIFTASGSTEIRLEVAKLGGRAFIQKPLSAAQVMETVIQVRQRSQTPEAKVMVVDDDAAQLIELRSFLEPWGLKLMGLSNPEKFLETLDSYQPDLLILDVEIPKIDGISLCQVVRNDPRWSGIPILFLTAHREPEMVHRIFAGGADDYVNKPIVGPELVTRILNRLERIQLLRNMAENDPLTGVANRRKSTQELNRFLQLAKRHKQPICFALLDLDYFKQINDKYGHAMGDAILHRLGRLLSLSFRSEDIVARWGGEEFVVVMYGMTKEDGMKRLSELLEKFQEQEFTATILSSDDERIDLETEDWSNESDRGGIAPIRETFCITFSAGIAQYPEHGSDLQSLYRCADRSLHQAKAAGRNCIMIAE
jgi:diguanylate cyclase (GGDEF)-like protein